jgi:hypothetical protein
MTVMKLQEALLRRKELQDRLARMRPVDQEKLFQSVVKRKPATEGVDDVLAAVPQVTWQEFEKERNLLSKQLRLVDAVIQQANWTTEVEVQDIVMVDAEAYVPDIKKE